MNPYKLSLFVKRLAIYLLTLFIVISIAVLPAKAQERNLDRELLVSVLPDSLELPTDANERIPIDQVEIASTGLIAALQELSITGIERSFPQWNERDSVRVLESGRIVHRPRFHRVFTIHLPPGILADEAVERLEMEPSVAYAHPHLNAQPETDTYYPDQWHLNNTGQAGGTAGADIQAEDAWNIFTGSSDIKIGIFDTGIDLSHVDLKDKSTLIGLLLHTADHGTHVAALAAGKANNQDGLVRGVDWNAQIVSAPVMNSNRNWIGDNHFASYLVDAVDNYGVHILNHSWGRPQISNTVGEALAYAYKMNRLNVTSAGNQGSGGLTFPASMGHGITAVGATENDDSRSSASSYGSKLNVTAPGGTNIGGPYDDEDIMSATVGNDADFLAGTSMASPIVAGIASLLKGYDNDLYNDDIQRIIELSADEVGNVTYDSNGWHEEYGYGRVNAYEALKLLQAPYELHHQASSGGFIHNTTTGWMEFYGVPGLAGGAYSVKRHEVRKTVHFSWMDEPNVWGRGVESVGYSNQDPNFAMGFTEVVSNSNNSAQLRTYVYEVSTLTGQFVGWFPTTPQNVEFAYTVHGIPGDEPFSAEISGNTFFGEGNPGQWDADVSGGTPPYDYTWYRSYNSSSGPWTQVGTSSSYNQMVNDEMWLRLTVAEDCPFMLCPIEEDIAHIEVLHCGNPPCPMPKAPGGGVAVPEAFALTQNYPNPFNPVTTISYDLPERSDVRLEVFNMLGQRVALLVDGQVQAGSHTAVFDASNLSSGTYLARISAYGSNGEQFVQSMTMQLVK